MLNTAKVRKAVITVAGLGTRFLPTTKSIPKEMIPVLNKPVIQYLVEEMADSGIEEVILVNSPQKQAINEYFKPNAKLIKHLKSQGKYNSIRGLEELLKKIKISFVYQKQALGNGHALLQARKKIGDEPFAFSDGDSIIDSKIPVTKQIIDIFGSVGGTVIGVQKIANKKDMAKYGNVYGKPIHAKRTYIVDKIVEKPKINQVSPYGLIIGGMRYIFTPDIWPILAKQKPSRAGEIWLADSANTLAKQRPFFAYEYEGKYFDTGTPEGLLATSLYFSKKKI